MRLTLDEGTDIRDAHCEQCGDQYTLVTSYLLADGSAFAVSKCALHDHDGAEAWIDVAFGSWGGEADDHVTFGCLVGPVSGSSEPAAMAVDAAVPYANSWLWGRKLSRDEALAHTQIQTFWSVVDFLLLNEPSIEHHVYHRSRDRESR